MPDGVKLRRTRSGQHRKDSGGRRSRDPFVCPRARLASRATLARAAHAPHCAYDSFLDESLQPAEVATARQALLLAHNRMLEERAPLKNQGLDVVVDVCWDRPLHESILRKAGEWGADFIVKDTHYQPALRRSIFSNTDWNLIRQSPIPLLLVKPRPSEKVPRVVAAVDPLHPRDQAASLDNRIVTYAKELAEAIGGETHLMHVCETTPFILASTEPVPVLTPQITADLERSHTRAVQTLAGAHGIARERIHMRTGVPRHMIIELTDEIRADVLVMGAISRSALERLFVGSTAEAVLDKVSCDVLIVKPADFK